MNNKKNIAWMFSIAAGTAVAILAGKSSRVRETLTNKGSKLKGRIGRRNRFNDDNEIFYI